MPSFLKSPKKISGTEKNNRPSNSQNTEQVFGVINSPPRGNIIRTNQKPFSWKTGIVSFVLAFLFLAIASLANGGYAPPGSIFWTFAWILLSIESWKFWRWRALLPYPASILCSLIIALIVVMGLEGDLKSARLMGSIINIAGLIVFAVIYLRKFEQVETNNAEETVELSEGKK